MSIRLLPRQLERWADAREQRNPDGHGKTGTALLRAAAQEIEVLREALTQAMLAHDHATREELEAHEWWPR